MCKDCKRPYDKAYRDSNKEKVARGKQKAYQARKEYYDSKSKEWVKNNKEGRTKIIQRYYQNNQQEILERQAVYREDNREICNERIKDWSLRNPDKLRVKDAKYRASKLKATPMWLSEGQQEDIKSIYNLARDCELVSGESYHVDHIVPLQGKTVCGLHVPWNLQVLPCDVNIKKGNRYNGW
jgi:hypothetical protein